MFQAHLVLSVPQPRNEPFLPRDIIVSPILPPNTFINENYMLRTLLFLNVGISMLTNGKTLKKKLDPKEWIQMGG